MSPVDNEGSCRLAILSVHCIVQYLHSAYTDQLLGLSLHSSTTNQNGGERFTCLEASAASTKKSCGSLMAAPLSNARIVSRYCRRRLANCLQTTKTRKLAMRTSKATKSLQSSCRGPYRAHCTALEKKHDVSGNLGMDSCGHTDAEHAAPSWTGNVDEGLDV
ncbi:hypothetical protein PISMIDRAFT_477590 [Pisolithus microcarpus 441]|uniref:Uncharacterized protein n=1 Tax=Pisolithus microcarpus 441 TaxID=765257 RepID=A0A0C9ZKE7_9AGAM|nr:hypothetical protein PISMIDRAFT_477590 [Pisolithus microcarpus 441]